MNFVMPMELDAGLQMGLIPLLFLRLFVVLLFENDYHLPVPLVKCNLELLKLHAGLQLELIVLMSL